MSMTTETLLVELGTEELPPKSLKALGLAFRDGIVAGLAERELDHGAVHWFATPRRLAVMVENTTLRSPDKTIEVLRKQRTTFSPVDRAAAEGDRVQIDFTGRKDGEVFEGGQAQDFPFVIGAGSMLKDFETAVLGLKAGDSWCLCAARFLQAHDEGCAPKVHLQATHIRALEIVPLRVLKDHALG